MAVVDTHVKFTDMDVHAPGFDIDVKSVDIRVNCPYESALTPVSYTHLTLPTILLV